MSFTAALLTNTSRDRTDKVGNPDTLSNIEQQPEVFTYDVEGCRRDMSHQDPMIQIHSCRNERVHAESAAERMRGLVNLNGSNWLH